MRHGRWRWVAVCAVLLTVWAAPPMSPVRAADTGVLTQHNDLARTGANLNETQLRPATVNAASFGKLFTRTVDGQVYAQPLVVPNLIVGGRARNVVIVATQHNGVYAFDADDASATVPLWQRSLEPSAPANDCTFVLPCGAYTDIRPEVGITSTPVVDLGTLTLYVVNFWKDTTGSANPYHHSLHKLDLLTGLDRAGSPVAITASVPGTGEGSVNGTLTFDSKFHLQRPALTLANGNVYVAFGSYADCHPYHGWLFAYRLTNLARQFVLNTTPNGRAMWTEPCAAANDGGAGAIWQSGNGLSVDATGNLYAITGNGTFSANTGGADYGTSFLKISPAGAVLDSFTPFDQVALGDSDADLGSQGAMLLPGTRLVMGGSKNGTFYVLDTANLGGFSSTEAQQNTKIVQSFRASSNNTALRGSAVVWASAGGTFAYMWPEFDQLWAYRFTPDGTGKGTFATTPASISAITNPLPESYDGGGILSLSANGNQAGTGIVWATHANGGTPGRNTVPGVLRAFDASNVSVELWNSEQTAARDRLGNYAKFNAPTIANGKVYVGTFSNTLVVYGSLIVPAAAPTVRQAAPLTPSPVVPPMPPPRPSSMPLPAGMPTPLPAPVRRAG